MKRFLLLTAALLTLAACDDMVQSAERERVATGHNQADLIARQPLPRLTHSQERDNLIERLRRINQQNLTGCVYLINYGHVMAFYPVRGKVSSLQAYLTANESSTGELPDLDGTYGQNSDGIFFFTAQGNAYVEWHGDYLWSDQCLTLNQEPALTRVVP